MSNIRLSICIPTYNFGAFIGETLSAVIDQSRGRDDIEIIVVDGASTDDTDEVVLGFQSRFPALVYHRLERKGGIDNDLAQTIALAHGDYCWFLSSDDVPVAGALQRMLREIDSRCDIYLLGRTICDRNLNPLHDQYWLNSTVPDRTFAITRPLDFIGYFSEARSIGALFSYISSIVVNRDRWNAVMPDNKFSGSNYAHAARLFAILLQGGTLRYIHEPLVFCRGENDSFAESGIVRRFQIDLDGYLLLASGLFDDAAIRQAFLAVMRHEHPWYVYAELKSRIGRPEQWSDFEQKLLKFGYESRRLAIVRVLGSILPCMFIARLLWFGLRRLRTAALRVLRQRGTVPLP